MMTADARMARKKRTTEMRRFRIWLYDEGFTDERIIKADSLEREQGRHLGSWVLSLKRNGEICAEITEFSGWEELEDSEEEKKVS